MSLKDNFWLRRAITFGVCAVSLFVLGLALAPLERPAWREVRSFQPELNLDKLEGALGQGLVLGLLGGFRTIIADMVFIRMNGYWEDKDREKTEALINLATAIDPRPMFFWLNGSRIMAYDIPIWRIREHGDTSDVPEAIQKQIYKEQAERGLALVDAAAAYHGGDYRIPLEKAQIYNNKLKDPETAAEYYLKAYESEDGPYYAARIYAELLRQAGREQEAYDFYRKHYAEVPDDDPRAMKDIVLERIREIEEDTNMPLPARFPSQPGELGSANRYLPFGAGMGGDMQQPSLLSPEYQMMQEEMGHDHSGHDHDHHDHDHSGHDHSDHDH